MHLKSQILSCGVVLAAASSVSLAAPILTTSVAVDGPNAGTWNMSLNSWNVDSTAANAFSDPDFAGISLPADRAGTDREYSSSWANSDFKIEYLANSKDDPFIESFFAIKNTGAVTLTFSVTDTLAVAPMLAGTYFGGSASGSVTDATPLSGTPALISSTTPLAPVFEGKIDGTTVYSSLYGLNVSNVPPALSAGFTQSEATGFDVNGFTTIPGPNATTSIGVAHTFRLSPGDIVSFTTYFQVDDANIVPEPASMGLLGLGALLLRRRR